MSFLPFMVQARSARAMKQGGKKMMIHNVPYGPSKRDVYYMALLIISGKEQNHLTY